MIVLINGAFGVGKSTVSRLLWQRVKGSRIYDPEWAGSVLMRLPAVLKLRGSGSDDFQDLEVWRWSVVRGTRLARVLARETVIVPMAFSRRDHFDEIVKGIRRFDHDVKVFCLKASLATIRERLQHRGERFDHRSGEWVIRNAQACIEAHRDPHFGEPIDTEGISAAEVAKELFKRLPDASANS
jgi:broad-specificity NMP kinase